MTQDDELGLQHIRRVVADIRERAAVLDVQRTAVHETETDIAGKARMLVPMAEAYGLADDPSVVEALAVAEKATRTMSGSGVSEPKPDRAPAGEQAALRVLADLAGEWHAFADIRAEIVSRGWMARANSPKQALRAALIRAVANGNAEKRPGKDPLGEFRLVRPAT